MNDVDPVQLAECLDIAPVIPEKDDLVKSLYVAAILDVIHSDLDARPAAASRGRVDIADHHAGVEIERVRLEELYERHRLPDRPEDLRRNAQVRLGVAANRLSAHGAGLGKLPSDIPTHYQFSHDGLFAHHLKPLLRAGCEFYDTALSHSIIRHCGEDGRTYGRQFWWCHI